MSSATTRNDSTPFAISLKGNVSLYHFTYISISPFVSWDTVGKFGRNICLIQFAFRDVNDFSSFSTFSNLTVQLGFWIEDFCIIMIFRKLRYFVFVVMIKLNEKFEFSVWLFWQFEVCWGFICRSRYALSTFLGSSEGFVLKERFSWIISDVDQCFQNCMFPLPRLSNCSAYLCAHLCIDLRIQFW